MRFQAPSLKPGLRSAAPLLAGSSDAWYLAQLQALQAAPTLILTETSQHALRLLDELRFFSPDKQVLLLPDWETLPYDHFSPHQDLISERLATLWQVRQGAFDVLIVPTGTAMQRLPPVEFLAAHTFFLKTKEKIDLDQLRGQMTLAGYQHVTQVYSPGEYSVRGGLIDLFPMGSTLPYRLDLFDDEIETIRTFDVDTQRSIYPVKEVRLLPAREFPLDEQGRTTFRRHFREQFEGDPSRSQLYKDIGNGMSPAGIEYYLPLFFEHTATLFDYLPDTITVVAHHDVHRAAERFWQDTQSRYNLLAGDRQRPLLPPQRLFQSVDELFAALKPYARLEVKPDAPAESALSQPLPAIQVDRRADNPLSRLEDFLHSHDGRVLILAESLGRRETMAGYLAEYGLKPTLLEDWSAFLAAKQPFCLAVGPVQTGFILGDGTALITESELYAHVARSRESRQSRKPASDTLLRDLSEVKIGDPVVHEQHGIGRYMGLVNLDLGNGEDEFLLLEYAGSDKLYVPVSHLYVISRYSGAAQEDAPLHKLGSGQWEKAKRKAAQQVRDTAAELLNLYAQRAAREGHAFELDEHDYQAFADSFGFEETPDQLAAITAVIKDMISGQPMDRLVCGDVGFGKTEVALRAAFVAVMGGKQVAVLVPTTLLAEQHFQNFSDRFADWPVKIAELSRFRTGKEVNAALKGLAEGAIDIVIGTHKLVQPDVQFKNLGLVIIDEEHRFGVRHKEQLKALRAEVDVLTLTATPIPRTLAMSLEGIRDFSVIATAPQKRLAIKTFVSRTDDGIIREAVLRELKRGGQVFFLHNEVETIENMREKLEKLLPEARIGIAHGQLRERELEAVMRDFHAQRFNILLCTTIVETGIDIPNANTIVINRADRFGLAQLHQLRGRVGRSHHQAYAYLLTLDESAVTAQAKKRLEAIQMMEELGSGFYLAMHDLEIRGAGEVLGDSQSGEMQEIGFNLYSAMLNEAVKALKKGIEPDLNQPLGVTTEINLHAPTLLPNDYCPDVHERLVIYKRLANCDTAEELDEMHQELIDRFGLPPEPAKTLLECHRLRLAGKPLGIKQIDATEQTIHVQFTPNPPIDPMKIIQLIQSNRQYKLAGPEKLKIEAKLPELAPRIRLIKDFFKALA
ncbi:transcription-repair coupling factor (superfamily II helicase) [Chitinivorax tropicus]|uniref:Transcription-repair-coupling factor n=1 Tax=Chitinivorax tropicus TaxID=714531 RepID=A0A840MRQ8_9PROT|nr:transcription-repair coupling factor [Chitinivorax tropicus]MBB5019797.1 transcription-repair coupling factor (superfamily II helicase) [Chitinivorax tropicus]